MHIKLIKKFTDQKLSSDDNLMYKIFFYNFKISNKDIFFYTYFHKSKLKNLI